MRNVLVVRSSNRSIDEQCAACVSALVQAGAGLVSQSGSSEVSFARNVALSRAVGAIKAGERPWDVVLLVDDDMVFHVRAAELVVAAARASGRPTSACYALGDGRLPFERLPSGRYMGGLGFVAVPVAVLLSVAALAHVFSDDNGAEFWEFTTSGSELRDNGSRRWLSEDYRLTRTLGGVDVLPVAVGHLKPKVVLPGREAFEALTKPQDEVTTAPAVPRRSVPPQPS